MMSTLLNNRYQIIQVLGSGGFGETFLAEDTYMPSRRRCVIKQIKPVTNDPQMYQMLQQRFGREAAILESLGEGSEQIPKINAYFSEKVQFYLVQEWIQGQTLTEIVAAQGPLNETAVRNILVSLLPVLDYVHSQGIIHRDIKPDNIILRGNKAAESSDRFLPCQSNGEPVLIDFGAVKETMSTVVNSKGKPTYSIVLGTPGFMPPEQASGRPIYASDLYSLGMTAIYLLTGKLPQELDTDLQTEDLLWQQHALNVSPSLAAVINKAIQYHPRDRYTTAMKMLDALQSVASMPPRQSSTHATLVVTPGNGKQSSQPAAVISPQSPAVINHPSSKGNWQKTLILGSLFAGSMIGASIIFNLVRNQPPQSSIATLPPPQSTSQQPIASSTPAAASPAQVQEPADLAPAPVTTQSPSPPTVSAPEQDNEQQTAQPEEPSFAQGQNNEQQTAQPEESGSAQGQDNEEQAAESPLPPAVSAPQQNNENRNNSAGNAPSNRVPGFPTGTSESKVKAVLGKPTKTFKGYWSNTRAVHYELDSNQITLGYLFDRNSGRIRQTEVAFDQSVDSQVMQATLQGMLGDRSLINVSQGLQQVYDRRADKYSFNVDGLKGVIERNKSDRIYIGVWDADLH